VQFVINIKLSIPSTAKGLTARIEREIIAAIVMNEAIAVIARTKVAYIVIKSLKTLYSKS